MEYSEYELMIIELALNYADHGGCHLDDSQVSGLAEMLNIEASLLCETLSIDEIFSGQETVDYCGYPHHLHIDRSPLLNFPIRYTIIRQCMAELKPGIDENSLITNYRILDCAAHHFEMLNADSSLAEADYTGEYGRDHNIYHSYGYNPRADLELFGILLSSLDSFKDCRSAIQIIKVLQMRLQHEITTRANTIYLISLMQIIEYSSHVDHIEKDIATEFYHTLKSLLHDAKVLAIQVNSRYQDLRRPPAIRTRNADNTTRLRILYGYDNYDAYSMRLDLPHKGQPLIHINNVSPGNIRACLLTNNEYQDIISHHPDVEDCFVAYVDRYALKERFQIPDVLKKDYEEIRERFEHKRAFRQEFPEEKVILFCDHLGNMLPANCQCSISKDREYEKMCFDYNRYMMLLSLICSLSIGAAESAERLYAILIDEMIGKGVIDLEDREYFTELGDICDFSNRLKHRIEKFSEFGVL